MNLALAIQAILNFLDSKYYSLSTNKYNQSLANQKQTCIKLLQNKHNTTKDDGVISNQKS